MGGVGSHANAAHAQRHLKHQFQNQIHQQQSLFTLANSSRDPNKRYYLVGMNNNNMMMNMWGGQQPEFVKIMTYAEHEAGLGMMEQVFPKGASFIYERLVQVHEGPLIRLKADGQVTSILIRWETFIENFVPYPPQMLSPNMTEPMIEQEWIRWNHDIQQSNQESVKQEQMLRDQESTTTMGGGSAVGVGHAQLLAHVLSSLGGGRRGGGSRMSSSL